MEKNNEINTVIKGFEGGHTMRMLIPLEMRWKPQEDITPYELALCLPFLFRVTGIMPYEIDKSLSHFRHFQITDHNEV